MRSNIQNKEKPSWIKITMQILNALQQNILNLTTLLVIPWLAKRYIRIGTQSFFFKT